MATTTTKTTTAKATKVTQTTGKLKAFKAKYNTTSGTSSGAKTSGSSGGSVAVSTTPNTVSTGNSGSAALASIVKAVSSKMAAASGNAGSSGGSWSSGAVNTTPPSSGFATGGYTANGQWVPYGTYNDADLRAAGQADPIDQYKQEFNEAKARGDVAGMQQAHAKAELYRAQYGYSGGADGSQKITTPQNTAYSTWLSGIGKTQQSTANKGLALSSYDETLFSETDKHIARVLKEQAMQALAAGNKGEAKQLHDVYEQIRAKYGYSGGSDGSQYIPIQQGEDILPNIALSSYEPGYDMANQLADASLDKNLSALLASYNNSRAEAEYQMGKLPALYQNQRNQVAAENEKQRAAFHENAAYSGMNAGNGSQAALAFSNQLQSDLGNLNTAEANALADAQHDLTKLYTQYQGEIAKAYADNNYERMAALMQEYQTHQNSVVQTAVNQANLDVDIARFNRETRKNARDQEQQSFNNQLAVDQLLTGLGYGGTLSKYGLSDAEIKRLMTNYSLIQAGWPDYAYLRGYGYSV